jgi:hypothetical protein
MSDLLAYLAAALVAMWGVAHVVPTARVLAGFEPITPDNRRVVLQEWLVEAFAMWGIAAFVVVAALAEGAGTEVADWIYRVAAVLLVAIAALTGLTGARTPVVWFKVCVVLLGCSAALLLIASVA